MAARRSSSNMNSVSGVRGTPTTTWSASATAARTSVVTSTPGTGLGAPDRVAACIRQPNGARRSATAWLMEPSPTRATVAPSREPRSASTQCRGGSVAQRLGSCLTAVRSMATTHSAMGTALTPRAHVRVRSPRCSNGKWSTPCPSAWTHRTPRCSTWSRFSVRAAWVMHTLPATSSATGPAVLTGMNSTVGNRSRIAGVGKWSPHRWTRTRVASSGAAIVGESATGPSELPDPSACGAISGSRCQIPGMSVATNSAASSG